MRDLPPIRTRLIPAGVRLGTLSQLRESCAAPMADILWRTCRWSRRPPVDAKRFAIFSVSPDETTPLYIRVSSAPHDCVLIEVTSDWSYPGAEQFIGAHGRRQLRRFGFRPSTSGTHYVREDLVLLEDDARRLAGELLTIVFDIFCYRGDWTFSVERSPEQRLKREGAGMLRPDDFIWLLQRLGYGVHPSFSPDRLTATLRRHGEDLVAEFRSRVAGADLYSWVTLRAPLRLARPLPHDIAGALSSRIPGVVVDRDRAAVERVIPLEDISLQWLGAQCAQLQAARVAAERLVEDPGRVR